MSKCVRVLFVIVQTESINEILIQTALIAKILTIL